MVEQNYGEEEDETGSRYKCCCYAPTFDDAQLTIIIMSADYIRSSVESGFRFSRKCSAVTVLGQTVTDSALTLSNNARRGT